MSYSRQNNPSNIVPKTYKEKLVSALFDCAAEVYVVPGLDCGWKGRSEEGKYELRVQIAERGLLVQLLRKTSWQLNRDRINEALRQLDEVEVLKGRSKQPGPQKEETFILTFSSQDKNECLRELRRKDQDDIPPDPPNPQEGNCIPKYIPLAGVEIEGFFGRDSQLTQLGAEIQKEGAKIALSGIGGVGKTEIAIQLARRYGDFFSGGICWISVFQEGSHNFESMQRRVAAEIASFGKIYLGIKIPTELLLSDKDQARYCLENWKNGNVLIIFDDVQSYENIKEYVALLIEKTRFRILITSRSRDFDSHIQLISLNELDSEFSLKFLSHLVKVKDERVDVKSPVTKDLCDLLGNLPLGIELIGKYINNNPDLLVGEVLEILKLRSEGMELPEYPGFDDPGRGATAKRGLIAAFDLTWAVLRDDARLLGRMLGRFAPAAVRWRLIEGLRGQLVKNRPELEKYQLDKLRKARQELISYNLLKESDLEQLTYRVHPLVWEYFRYKEKRELSNR